MNVEVCQGCGSRLERIDGPLHAYMLSSPTCWAAFNEVAVREYSNVQLLDVHRLSVDAWAVQHPGDGSRRAIQSVGLHLARLMVQLEQGLHDKAANNAMLGFATRKATLPELPPRKAYRVTVADVLGSVDPETHRRAILHWAEATWQDWADQHDFIRNWAAAAA